MIPPRYTPNPIEDSIWLAGGSLLVGTGHQMLLFGRQPDKQNGQADPSSDLFETVARQNGPLEDYHPQMLLQCLLWGAFVVENWNTRIHAVRR